MNRIQNHMHKWSFLIHVLITSTLVRGGCITLHNYELIKYYLYFISKTSLCNI